MKANPNNYQDVLKYFQGTLIVIPEVDKEKVFLLRNCGPNGIIVQDPSDASEGFIELSDKFTYTIQSPLPIRRAWFMHQNKPMFIERIPARMWKKGICTKNTALWTFTENGLAVSEIHWAKLNSFLQFKPPTTLPEKFVSPLILDDRFALLGPKNTLFLWDKAIGQYAGRTKELFICRELADLPLPSILSKMKIVYV